MCLPGRPLVKVHSKQWLAQFEEHHTAAVQFKGAEWECAVGRGKEVGGEVSIKPNPPRSSTTFAAWRYISNPRTEFVFSPELVLDIN